MPAIVSAINKGLVLRGVSAAVHTGLVGPVVYEDEQRVMIPVAGEPSALLNTRVLRSGRTGLLDFYYRLSMQKMDYDHALRLSLSFGVPGVVVSFADFRIDGPGTLPPNYFESSPSEQAIFRFDYGLSVGRDSRFCFVSTNAREFREKGGKVNLICHNKRSVGLDAPGILSLAPVMPSIPEAQPD